MKILIIFISLFVVINCQQQDPGFLLDGPKLLNGASNGFNNNFNGFNRLNGLNNNLNGLNGFNNNNNDLNGLNSNNNLNGLNMNLMNDAIIRLENLNRLNSMMNGLIKFNTPTNSLTLTSNNLNNKNNLGDGLNGQLTFNRLNNNNGLNGLTRLKIRRVNLNDLNLNEGYKFSVIGSHLTGLQDRLNGGMGMILGGNQQTQLQPQQQQQQPQLPALGFTDQLNYGQNPQPIPVPQSNSFNTPTVADYKDEIQSGPILAPGRLSPLPNIPNLPQAPAAFVDPYVQSGLTANTLNSRANAGLFPASTFNGGQPPMIEANNNNNANNRLPNLPQLNNNNLGNGLNFNNGLSNNGLNNNGLNFNNGLNNNGLNNNLGNGLNFNNGLNNNGLNQLNGLSNGKQLPIEVSQFSTQIIHNSPAKLQSSRLLSSLGGRSNGL